MTKNSITAQMESAASPCTSSMPCRNTTTARSIKDKGQVISQARSRRWRQDSFITGISSLSAIMRGMGGYSIGVDLGGTNLRAAAIRSDGIMLEKTSGRTEIQAGPDAV